MVNSGPQDGRRDVPGIGARTTGVSRYACSRSPVRDDNSDLAPTTKSPAMAGGGCSGGKEMR